MRQMNVPLVGNTNREMARRAFEDALGKLCQGVIYQGGLPAVEVGMMLLHHGLAIHTQTVLAGVQSQGKVNGVQAHEPQAEAVPT